MDTENRLFDHRSSFAIFDDLIDCFGICDNQVDQFDVFARPELRLFHLTGPSLLSRRELRLEARCMCERLTCLSEERTTILTGITAVVKVT